MRETHGICWLDHGSRKDSSLRGDYRSEDEGRLSAIHHLVVRLESHQRMTGMTSETKKKIRPGLIEADPRESQILVHYETDEIVDGKVPFDTFTMMKHIHPLTKNEHESNSSVHR
jgi:hypothetical protein